MKSCNCFKGGDDNGGKSQQLQFNYYCWLFITSLDCACHDFNVWLKLCVVIKFWAKLKAAHLANFPLMSRHMIVCRDISKLWEDKLSSGCDIKQFMTVLFCHDITFGRDITLVLPSILTK